MSTTGLCAWRKFHFSHSVGFLLEDPLEELPCFFSAWNKLAKNVPNLLHSHTLRAEVHQLPELDHTRLGGHREWRLAALQLSFIGSGYIWQDGDKGVPKSIPRQLAVPWCGVTKKLGFKPVVSHSTLVLSNYAKIDPERPLKLSNMRALYLLPGGRACEWFILVTVQIELHAVPGIKAIFRCQEGVTQELIDEVKEGLLDIETSINSIKSTLARMPEELEPDTFYNTVRPWLSGWGGSHSILPNGLVFEGVRDYPSQAIGGSAAQMSAMQCFDAALGVEHSLDSQKYLETIRDYMPSAHADMIRHISCGPSIRTFVKRNTQSLDLHSAFNNCLKALEALRTLHIKIVTRYIVLSSKKRTSQREYADIQERGTGGQTPLPFLKELRSRTHDAILTDTCDITYP